MSFISVDLGDDIQEDKPVDEDNYTLTINTAEETESKRSGAAMIVITHSIDGHPDAALVYHNMVLPKEDDDEKVRRFKLLNIKRYLALVGIEFDPNGFDADELVGMSFDAYLTKDEIEQEDPNAAPRYRNSIAVPRLSE